MCFGFFLKVIQSQIKATLFFFWDCFRAQAELAKNMTPTFYHLVKLLWPTCQQKVACSHIKTQKTLAFIWSRRKQV